MEKTLGDILRENFNSVDIDQAYDDDLDELYDFKSLGGPFKYMLASNVLKEVDPVAYDCGKSDYVDSCDLIEEEGDYWNSYDYEEAEAMLEELLEEEEEEEE